jgi:hypothetical protein
MKTRLPALEKNILVYRALQMSLFLFYSESARRLLADTVGSKIRKKTGQDLKGAKLMKAIFASLVHDATLTEEERDELEALIDHRNTIAHDIYRLTGDIEIPGRRYGFAKHLGLSYDYKALERMMRWKDAIWEKLAPMHILPLGLDWPLFEAAEAAYLHELASLRKRIDRQYKERKQKSNRA